MRLSLILLLALTACQPNAGEQPDAAFVLPEGRVVDLSHPYDEDTIYWPTAEGFKLTVDFEGMTDKDYYYTANTFCSAEHGGTHIDAPIHFAEGRASVDQIPLDQLPETGFLLIALPMKIAGGSGGPLRIVAIVPEAG